MPEWKPGAFRVERINARPHVVDAPKFIEVSRELVDQIRSFPSEWSWADDDKSVTIRDDEATYVYRLVPHSPLTYAGELTSRTAR